MGADAVDVDPATRDAVCLFLHIPKTAGTTLKDSMYVHYAGRRCDDGWFRDGIYYFPYGFHKAERPAFEPAARAALGREDLRAVFGHFWYGAHAYIPQPSFYVTFLRDPVDRVVSLYHHILGKESEPLHEAIVSRGATLEEFVADFACREVDNDQTRRIAGVEPPFGGCDATMLERAKRNLRERFAFVGITERFDESLVALKRVLDWPYVFYLPALVNGSRPRRDALSRDTVELVSSCNEHDLALYEYARGLLQERIDALGDSFAAEVDRFRESNRIYVEQARAAQAASG